MINTDYLSKCIDTLESALVKLHQQTDEEYRDVYRAVCIKEFEIILEQSGKLLKKILAEYYASKKTIDKLMYKDIFRYANKHSLVDTETCERL